MIFKFSVIKNLQSLILELKNGLTKLDLLDNTESFEAKIEIKPRSEIKIQNKLLFIPSKYIIVSQEGEGQITKSTTSWTTRKLFLKNNGNRAVKATVIFMR